MHTTLHLKRFLETALATKKTGGGVLKVVGYDEIRQATDSLVMLLMGNTDDMRARHLQLSLEILLFQA